MSQKGSVVARHMIESALTDMGAKDRPILIVNLLGYVEDRSGQLQVLQCGLAKIIHQPAGCVRCARPGTRIATIVAVFTLTPSGLHCKDVGAAVADMLTDYPNMHYISFNLEDKKAQDYGRARLQGHLLDLWMAKTMVLPGV
jgi:hypothetical protein